ncbi:hypothetical protein Pcinc_000501 [Petrolisthes cinctipes]|uniref:Methyltransferase type 11 domain-containing protein n=1 Tax=Petrolisthes cinctipes TaxID=88211 RepID=A0AAE1GS50_PETCI|nr:hypothetical protein Pcinc_000501 [Petrolisthes cinctipes]
MRNTDGKAGKSEVEKHAEGKKHIQNIKAAKSTVSVLEMPSVSGRRKEKQVKEDSVWLVVSCCLDTCSSGDGWMAEVDYLLAVWIKTNMIYLVLGGLVLVFLWSKRVDIRHRWFAYFMHLLNKDKNPKVEEMKSDLFSSLSSVTSHDPELRKKNAIRILEIGVGTGVNFSHYPDGTHLVVVDPNPHFASYYDNNRKKFPNIESEEILVTTGEDMRGVADNSIDVVVMTLVLCSVTDTKEILKEILRVLVPGGKYYFLEHIREFEPKTHRCRRMLQDFLSSTGIWPFLFDGCYLDRDMLPAIQEAGFSKVEARKFHAPLNNLLLKLIIPHLKGVGQK